MATNEELAELLFPDVTETIEDLEKKYPPRELPEGAQVTRFAPSPTGFLHTGSLFTSLISYTIAKESKGVYFFRLEDTDTKRTIAGSADQLINLENSASLPMKAIGRKAIKVPMGLINRANVATFIVW